MRSPLPLFLAASALAAACTVPSERGSPAAVGEEDERAPDVAQETGSPAPVPGTSPDTAPGTTPPPSPESPASGPETPLLGGEVLDLRHEERGKLLDLAIEIGTGRIAFAIIDAPPVRDTPGGDGPVVVPRSLVTWDPESAHFVLRATWEELAGWERHDLEESPPCALLVRRGQEPPASPPPARNPDLIELFRTQEIESVHGTVTAVEAAAEGADEPVFVKLHDEENLHHRVRLGPKAFLDAITADLAGELSVGKSVDVEGVRTRDANGLLWVASRLKVEQGTIELRDKTGRPLWREETPPADAEAKKRFGLVSLARFPGTPILSSAGGLLLAGKVILDPGMGRALSFTARTPVGMSGGEPPGHEEGARGAPSGALLPWDRLRGDPAGELRALLDASAR